MSDEIVGGHEGFRRPDGRPEDGARPEVRLAGSTVELTTEPLPAPPAPRPPRSARTKRLLAAGLAVAVLAVAVPVALTSGGDEQEPAATPPQPSAAVAPTAGPADGFRAAVSAAFDPLGGVLNVFLVTKLRGWQAGTVTDAEARAAFDNTLPGVERARDQLAAIPGFDPAPRAKADYEGAVLLYLQTTRLGLAAAALPASPVQRQLRVQTLRLQALGDRVFDQGSRDLAGFLQENPEVGDVTIQPPPEIPDFTARGQLPAAPLVPGLRSEISVVRPTGDNQQAEESWIAEVRAVAIPSAQEVGAAITAGDPAALGALANRLTAATLAVRALDDPASGRGDSTRVQLSLFLAAEAARAAEAAALLPAAARQPLLTVAMTLAAQSDRMWDERLGGPRDSGFPVELLTAR